MKPLKEFSDQHLAERFQGLGKNLFLAEGRLFLPSDVRQVFLEAYGEVRRRGMSTRLDVERFIVPTDPMPIIHTKSVVRYSKQQWLEQFRTGIVRFASAAQFARLANAAQKDDELKRSWYAPDTEFVINGVKYPASNLVMNKPVSRKDGGAHVYHSLSFSFEESAKLQRAFDAEGYVVIQDYQVFHKTIADALRSRSSESQWSSGPVSYYDDVTEPKWKDVAGMVFSKSILFKYQHEVRIAVFNPPVEIDSFEISVKWPSNLLSAVRTF